MHPTLSPIKELDHFNTIKQQLNFSVDNTPPPSIESIGRTTHSSDLKSKGKVPGSSPSAVGKSPVSQGRSPRGRPSGTPRRNEPKTKAKPVEEPAPNVESPPKASPRTPSRTPSRSGKSPARGKTLPKSRPGNSTPKQPRQTKKKYTSKERISSSDESSSDEEPEQKDKDESVEVDVVGFSSPEKDPTPKSHKPVPVSSKRPELPAPKRRGRPPKNAKMKEVKKTVSPSFPKEPVKESAKEREKARRSSDTSNSLDVISVLESVSVPGGVKILSPIPSIDYQTFPTVTTSTTSTSASTMASMATSIAVSNPSSLTTLPSINYINGKPSIMVHLDLALIGLSHVSHPNTDCLRRKSQVAATPPDRTHQLPQLKVVRSEISVEEGEIRDDPEDIKPTIGRLSAVDTAESMEDAASDKSLDVRPSVVESSIPAISDSGKNAKKTSSSEKKNAQEQVLSNILPKHPKLTSDLGKIPRKRKKEQAPMGEDSGSSKKSRVSDKAAGKVSGGDGDKVRKRPAPSEWKSEAKTTPVHTANDITDRE